MASYFLISLISYIVSSFFIADIGIIIILISIIGTFTSRNLVVMIFSLMNIFLGHAFFNYIDQGNPFVFYYSNGIEIEYLAKVTFSVINIIYFLDYKYTNYNFHSLNFKIKTYQINQKFFFPIFFIIFFTAMFLFLKEINVFSEGFNKLELEKFSFLEYLSILIFFLFASIREKKTNYLLAIFVVSFLIIVSLLSSFRLVAIIYSLSLFFCMSKENTTNRLLFLFFTLVGGYVVSVIGLYRGWIPSADLLSLVGYKNGILDNTFTGIIETALIYSSSSTEQNIFQNIKFLIGVILPLPNSLIPDDFLYYKEIYTKHFGRIPGGGLLSGFIIYFNYLLVPFILFYFHYAFKHAKDNKHSAAMYYIILVTLPRWWLYGPYVLFKFLSFYFVVYIITQSILKNET